jgi:antitoxin component of RelBE/YafQ-DinJ toxin-antitoxin module
MSQVTLDKVKVSFKQAKTPKTFVIGIRVTEKERQEVQAMADYLGLSVSDLTRQLLQLAVAQRMAQ